MRVSVKWLMDYVPITCSAAALAEKLTMAGLEVESVETSRAGFAGVVVGKILDRRPHPDAGRLALCTVSTGDRAFPVVCGAPNLRPGDLVPFAPVGAVLPGGDVIRSARIRGEVSEGMLCSEAELGLGEDAAGLLVLPSGLTPGQDLAAALDLEDAVLDVAVTPNRGDCLSLVGIAREVAALTGETLRLPPDGVREGPEEVHAATSVSILSPDLCPRYTARMLRNVAIKPSPLWLRRRLEAVGLRTINNVVDVTNYVMMELGQPLHAFDFRFLAEGRIVVRRAREGEPFVSLDGKERILRGDALLICDGVQPVALAGIMGGLHSEVKEDTTTVLLESALFDPVSIRKTARWLGMNTDAAFRFERGVDPGGVVRALNRAAALMAEFSGGTVLRGVVDAHPAPVAAPAPVRLRFRRVNQILGTNLTSREIGDCLRRLEMDVREEGPASEACEVLPPTCRNDLTREIDLIEEVARIRGYEDIPSSLPLAPMAPGQKPPGQAFAAKLRECLGGMGFSEVITYSFIAPAAAEDLLLPEGDRRRRAVRIRNPLTEDQSVMRSTLAWGLLDTVRTNARHACHDLKLFEIGRVFAAAGDRTLPDERNRLACLLTGARYDDLWHFSGIEADVYDMKGALEVLCDALRLSDIRFEAPAAEPFLHPGRSAAVKRGQDTVGYFGEIHPRVLRNMDLRGRLQICEVDVDLLFAQGAAPVSYREISRYPATLRDVAFVVPRDLAAGDLLALIEGLQEEWLENVSVFDVYTGTSLPPDTKSLGIRFRYRAQDRTLTDEEVHDVHAGIVKGVIVRTGAKIRGEGQ